MAMAKHALQNPFLSRSSNLRRDVKISNCMHNSADKISSLSRKFCSLTVRGETFAHDAGVEEKSNYDHLKNKDSTNFSLVSNPSFAEQHERALSSIKLTTSVPKSPEIRNGEWNEEDEKLVQKALRESGKRVLRETGKKTLLGLSLDQLEDLCVELGEVRAPIPHS